MIPKVIWTYWDTEELPEFIQKCIETWRHFNSDYEINILNMNNYQKYTDMDVTKLRHYSKDKPQLTADYIRVILLKKHGGVWMDASIICTKPIKFKSDTEFFVYYSDNNGILGKNKYPIVENWFIATSKNNIFMNEWYNEFILETEKYNSMLSYVLLSGVHAPSRYFTGYFAMHIAAQKVLIKLDNENKLPSGMVLINAWIYGPLHNYDYKYYAEYLCKINFNAIIAPVIKIVSNTRKQIMSDKKSYDCIIDKIKSLNKTESLGENEYIEDSGYSNLDGNFHKLDEEEYKKRIIIIISVIAIILLLAMVIIIMKKK
jgi:hypothetical protein